MVRDYTAIGLMSGTSLDGVDAALLSTDGTRIQSFGPALSIPYPAALRARLRAVLGATAPVAELETEITRAHARAVTELLARADISPAAVDVIGFHGALLARLTALDDWMLARAGAPFDVDGTTAASGHPDESVLAALLSAPYFDRMPPKSLDRLDFTADAVAGLGTADGAATLVAFTCRAIARSLEYLPEPSRRWLVTGGGRKNLAILAALAACLDVRRVGGGGGMGRRRAGGSGVRFPRSTLAPRPATHPPDHHRRCHADHRRSTVSRAVSASA